MPPDQVTCTPSGSLKPHHNKDNMLAPTPTSALAIKSHCNCTSVHGGNGFSGSIEDTTMHDDRNTMYDPGGIYSNNSALSSSTQDISSISVTKLVL
jgi:hypothetical protein